MASDRLAEVIKETRHRVLDFNEFMLEHRINDAIRRSESPIEELFAVALVGEYLADLESETFEQQVQIGDYRVDFLLSFVDEQMADNMGGGTALEPSRLVVELDGHEFHEKTKQQAKRDKSRDRELMNRGYQVARYTGSEIYADPFACAKQANHLCAFGYYQRVIGPDTYRRGWDL